MVDRDQICRRRPYSPHEVSHAQLLGMISIQHMNLQLNYGMQCWLEWEHAGGHQGCSVRMPMEIAGMSRIRLSWESGELRAMAWRFGR
jgi:hypothetical protein